MKVKLIKELEEAKLQTSKEWLDGFNKGIDRAIELTEANREEELEEIEDGIPTIPSYVAKEIEKILNTPNTPDGWNLEGYTSYLVGDGLINITDNKDVHKWAKNNPKLFLRLLGGNLYKVRPEAETVDHDPRDFNWDGFLAQKVQKPVVY